MSFYIHSVVPINQIVQNKIAATNFARVTKEISLVDKIRSRTNDRKDTKFWCV